MKEKTNTKIELEDSKANSQISNNESNKDSFIVSSEDDVSKSIISEMDISTSKKPKNEEEVKILIPLKFSGQSDTRQNVRQKTQRW